MRIVEPNQRAAHQQSKPPKKKSKKWVLFVIVLAAAVYGGYSLLPLEKAAEDNTVAHETSTDEQTADEPTVIAAAGTPGEFRTFSGNEFRILYDQLLQPNLDKVDTPPSITGDDTADMRIRQIAEARGYRLRSSPSIELTTRGGVTLQEIVHDPWQQMQAAASNDGIQMSVVSAFRSVDVQRQLFTSRLSAAGASVAQVAAGTADEQVDAVLVTSSIPGYSKHHTGYTIDLACAGYAFENFGNSPCYDWISANNYEKAKQYGFIPSYPPDADMQGPDPEAWEYVYVGTDVLIY